MINSPGPLRTKNLFTMFAKIFIFLLFGSTLILANPVQDNETIKFGADDVRLRGVFGTVQSWLKKADDTISSVYDRVTQPFKKVVQLVVETGEGVMDYTKEKFEQLMYKYYEIKRKSEENLNAVKSTFILKVISELQRIIDALSQQTGAESLEKLKQKTQEIAESSKDALEKLQQQLQASIEAEKKKLEENLDQWKQDADNAVDKNKRRFA